VTTESAFAPVHHALLFAAEGLIIFPFGMPKIQLVSEAVAEATHESFPFSKFV
jgi:hypothetical protein